MRDRVRRRKRSDCNFFVMLLDFFFPDPVDLSAYQLIFMVCVYFTVLLKASMLVVEGSELLILVPAVSGIVGSVIIPLLGTIPEVVLIVFSGLGEDGSEVVSIGVGALAGSTVLMMTVGFFLVIFAGRVSVGSNGSLHYNKERDGTDDGKLKRKDSRSLFRAAIALDPQMKVRAIFLLSTGCLYLLVEVCALGSFTTGGTALTGCLCIIGLLAYLLHQFLSPQLTDALIAQKRVEAIQRGEVSFKGAMQGILKQSNVMPRAMSESLAEIRMEIPDDVKSQLEVVLTYFFGKYDMNGDGTIDFDEFRRVMIDLHEDMSLEQLTHAFGKADIDKSGAIDFNEFVMLMFDYLQKLQPDEDHIRHQHSMDEDLPDDIAMLAPEQQQMRIIQRSVWKLLLGVFLIVIFSHPSIYLFEEVGQRTSIDTFYLSFIFSPLPRKLSDLIGAYNYARRKTVKSVSISLDSLIGGAILNNTLALSVLLWLIFAKNVNWHFHAEMTSILFVEVVMGGILYFRRSLRLAEGLGILSMYPLCILICFCIKLSSY